MASSNDRKKKTSPLQLEIMITFMEKHLDFARGTLKRNESDRLWNHLQTKLNAAPDGPVKTVKQWKMTWYYRKRCVKKDVRALCAQQKMDPDDVLQVHGLKDLDYRILKIMGNIEILKEDGDESLSGASEESEADDTNQIVTRSVSRASQNSTKTKNSKNTEDAEGRTGHFAAYISDRMNEIKNEKKRKNLEDEIIDLIRKCTIEDKK